VFPYPQEKEREIVKGVAEKQHVREVKKSAREASKQQ
jgi:hypothetical protein